MQSLLARLAPEQAGALWVGVVVLFVVFGDLRRPFSRRNMVLLALLSVAPFLYDLLDVGPTTRAWSFRAVFVLTLGMALWGVRLSRSGIDGWLPNLPIPALKTLAAGMVLMTSATVLTQPADDAGIYTSLGAQRWRETGQLPYSDEKLKGPESPAFGAAATYGPVLYLLHLPAQQLLGPPDNPPDSDPMDRAYVRPPMAATQVTTWVMFLVGLAAFFVLARRMATEQMAWAMVASLAALPYFIGFGGSEFVVGGLRYASHIVPVTFTLLAFLWLGRPIVAGATLAVATGVLFYPGFFFPIWLAWYWFRGEGSVRFASGFLAGAAVIALGVVFFSEPAAGESALRLFLESTLEHQEGSGELEYGTSPFSFWAYHPRAASIFQVPLMGDTSLLKLSFLLFAGFCVLLSFMTRGRSVAQLAALTGSAAAAIQLWKTHATGTYVEWYLPFLMIALFLQSERFDTNGGAGLAEGEDVGGSEPTPLGEPGYQPGP